MVMVRLNKINITVNLSKCTRKTIVEWTLYGDSEF
jgi:hypothetical protein